MRLRVVTWNIHKGIGGVDRRYRLDRTSEVLQALSADIVLLQEVADGMPGCGMDNQLEELSESLELRHVAYGAEHRFRVGGYGNAILSRFPVTDSARIDLTIGRRKRRGLVQTRVHARLEDGAHTRSVVVFNLHLGLSGAERATQLERFLACHPFAHLHHDTPLVVGGDFNDVWASLGPRFLEPAGLSRAGKLQPTFPAALPLRPLDGLWIRGSVSVLNAHPVRNALSRAASDHLPIVADLELLPVPHDSR
ncbi:MAG TPA: endonuclease/exonuclease/phosphatase family protein [Polyangiaceae bacterium]|nr:endonuclease/exonuclease/phosphatase family protein [Polyangiaceae bacterium]